MPSVTGASEPEVRFNYVPIKNRDEAERPREKLHKYGPSSLSDAELLALIFGSGTRANGKACRQLNWVKLS
ncbi:MAG: UPF0758 domain-containing protein, partial [Rubricoccaceae bacterium]|nr:UPF0758 domain-containing protein [Rubricoccaceae bacterium]